MENIVNLLQKKIYTVPGLLLENYKKLNLNEKELVFMIFIVNNSLLFNPKYIADSLHWTLPEVLEVVDTLTQKSLLSIEVRKDHNICEEYLSISSFYEQLAFTMIDEKKEKEVSDSLFDSFENEFGRSLSPIEYEIIKGWLESNFTEEIILLALKEAVYNGVFRLNYIDKILFEWRKKGIKTKQDVQKNQRQFNERKKNTEEVFEYDWLNE